ncbi:mitochondrial distribution and morphology protein 31-like [Teratosphaeria destructans]|uniref:Mitochondrial distribution and morphology protein 31-like n=1 Tax=Teratosphaeria destructans TaxID=418781 RepID=A0A9W7SRC5_9PEZI|nr:mitochondrial distribution and morphology protein 31-like [Teratosphaeria destructans]
MLNTVFAQETLAGWVGNYLTKSSGLRIVFESAIVPTWRDGVITFNNVFVSRRPGQANKKVRSVSKGSSISAAAAAAEAATQGTESPEEEGNYSQFDVTIQIVNVTLSFTKWFNGKGLLHDVEIKGVRGVIDRTHVHPIEGAPTDPKSYRHTHNTGDFEIDNFRMEDVLLTIHQPRGFRPFSVSVYNCELPRLRKQWLFYDFLCANNMSGSFDDSLFTIHPRQVHSVTGANLEEVAGDEDASQWKKHSRLRIDGLKIDHLNRGVTGPFSWITEGNVDIVADVMIPDDADGSIAKVMSDFYDRLESTVIQNQRQSQENVIRHDQREEPDDKAAQQQAQEAQTGEAEADKRFVVLDIRVQLNDVRASVPIFTKDLSYVNNALVRPIVAYINSRRSFIPVNCRVVKRQSEFDGSWTIFDSGLLDDLSKETYDAFVNDITDERVQRRRIKKVGVWTLQLGLQALFLGLAGQFA